MTATPMLLGAWTPASDHNAIPWALARKLAAGAQIGKGQFATVSLSTGYAQLNDGATPNQISAGNGDVAEISDTSSVAGAAAARFSQRWFYGLSMGTSTDAFTDADFCVPFWIKDENTLGKLSNLSGNNRSLGGLVFGLAHDGTPYAWDGPVAHLLARGAMIATSYPHAWYTITDASPSTATTERAIPRAQIHGHVTSIVFVGAAISADSSDYATITLAKRDGAGGGATTLGTYSTATGSNGAITAFVPASFTLSSTSTDLDLLETDIVTITVTKNNSGKQLIGEILVNGKAI